MVFLMNFIQFLCGHIFVLTIVDSANVKFTAFTDFNPWLLQKLYLDEWNEDPPSELDPARTDASIRLQICDDISNSRGFAVYYKEPVVDTRSMYFELKQSQYSDILQHIFSPSTSQNPSQPYKYTNLYHLRRFDVSEFYPIYYNVVLPMEELIRDEYVFACLLQKEDSNDIVPFYVSKEYSASKGIHVHRFVLNQYDNNELPEVMLVERSAEVYAKPEFNVELHYLELRKHHEPVVDHVFDPVCKYTFSSVEMRYDFRVCAIVFTSTYFKDKVKYPRREFFTDCHQKRITFRTEEGIEEAFGKSFNELMIPCDVDMMDGYVQTFYISRAYNPNQVFVYTHNPSNTTELHLENLSTLVNIVQDNYNFGDVEI